MIKIFVYDNEEAFKVKIEQTLSNIPEVSQSFDISRVGEDNFRQMIETLVKRQRMVRTKGTWQDGEIFLDTADIFVIDYDLLSEDPNSFSSEMALTGERISYLARCFSTCGLIVGINQFPLMDFDLTLKGHLDSYADLNITDRCLGNPGLWGKETDSFRPWYWPNLIGFLDDFGHKIQDIQSGLDNPIYQVVGIPVEIFENLPRSIGSFLGKQPIEITPKNFVCASGNGLEKKDEKLSDNAALSRIAAARISKWIERWILPGQDILIDAPHLVSRFPSILAGDVNKKSTWDSTATFACFDKLGLKVDLIDQYRLKKSYWASRPVWFWEKIRELETIDEVREPWNTVFPDWFFCEDTSRFVSKELVEEFVAEIETPYSRRYLEHKEEYGYDPLYRISL
jgi:hypothetical protein